MFNISIDSLPLNIFSTPFSHSVQIIERANVLLENKYFRIFKFSILTANNTIIFFHLKLFN